jgi:hypothetical protein
MHPNETVSLDVKTNAKYRGLRNNSDLFICCFVVVVFPN